MPPFFLFLAASALDLAFPAFLAALADVKPLVDAAAVTGLGGAGGEAIGPSAGGDALMLDRLVGAGVL